MHNLEYKRFIKVVDKDFMQKCDACNFDSDKDKLKIDNIKEQRFARCHNCD